MLEESLPVCIKRTKPQANITNNDENNGNPDGGLTPETEPDI